MSYLRSDDPARIARLTKAGQRLRIARLTAGLSQREVADVCGFSASCLSHYETGAFTMSDRQLGRILTAIDALSADPR